MVFTKKRGNNGAIGFHHAKKKKRRRRSLMILALKHLDSHQINQAIMMSVLRQRLLH